MDDLIYSKLNLIFLKYMSALCSFEIELELPRFLLQGYCKNYKKHVNKFSNFANELMTKKGSIDSFNFLDFPNSLIDLVMDLEVKITAMENSILISIKKSLKSF